MAKKDLNQLAADILKAATGEPAALTRKGKRNPAGLALARSKALRKARKGQRARTKRSVR